MQKISQQTNTCLKSTKEILGKGVKYVESYQSRHQNDVIDVFLVSLF